MKQFVFQATAYVPVPKHVTGRVTASSYATAASRAAKSALRHASFKRKRFDPTQGLTLRLVPAGAIIALLLLFAPAANANVFVGYPPIEKTPEWGAMTKPAQWNRTYDQYKATELIDPPAYNLRQLTGRSLAWLTIKRRFGSKQAVKDITAKLFYSTRYCGTYDVDVGEFADVPHPHCAIDMKAPIGTPIHAVLGGRVSNVTAKDLIFGISVSITDNEGRTWLYAHMKKTDVKKGDRVRGGAVIGTVGSTGATGGPHLHLQLNGKDGKTINPASFLPY